MLILIYAFDPSNDQAFQSHFMEENVAIFMWQITSSSSENRLDLLFTNYGIHSHTKLKYLRNAVLRIDVS